MDPAQTEKIINGTDPGWSVIAVAVPTRALRLIADEKKLVFRIEQLHPQQVLGQWTFAWRPVATHTDDKDPWYPLGRALDDMGKKQTRLREKIKLAQHDARMAQVRAQETNA